MKTFFEWLLLENLEELSPKEEIGRGHFAKVYATQNPKIVMRIEKANDTNASCEKFMDRPIIQATGGVAKVYGKKIEDGNYVTYKEKVNTDWPSYLASKYGNLLNNKYNIPQILQMMPYGLETASEQGEVSAFLQLALETFRKKEDIIEFLENFPEADGLIKAINMGLPVDDLHSDNLGINEDGKLVAIDC